MLLLGSIRSIMRICIKIDNVFFRKPTRPSLPLRKAPPLISGGCVISLWRTLFVFSPFSRYGTEKLFLFTTKPKLSQARALPFRKKIVSLQKISLSMAKIQIKSETRHELSFFPNSFDGKYSFTFAPGITKAKVG